MKTVLLLTGFALTSVCHGFGVLTKNMIKTPEERYYEPVSLVTKDEVVGRSFDMSRINETVTELPLDNTTIEELENEETQEEDEDDDDEEDENNNENVEDENDINTEAPKILKIGPTGRTRLFPVGRLWEKTNPDIWTVLSAAMHCLWSGLGMDCFTFRVVPMVKSMMGYHYSEFQPFFLAPREDETEIVEGRRRRRHHLLGILKLMKGALAGAIGVKTLLLPVLAGLALVAGKSIIFSLTSVLLSAAAAWTGIKSAADRRVQAGAPDGHAQYYVM